MITGEASGKPDEAFAYFKQELETLRRKQENEKKNIAALIDDHLPDLATVSYTHLDVYKRQSFLYILPMFTIYHYTLN